MHSWNHKEGDLLYIGAITTNHPGEPQASKPLVDLFQICLRIVSLHQPSQNISATNTDQLIENAYRASSAIELHNQDEVNLPASKFTFTLSSFLILTYF